MSCQIREVVSHPGILPLEEVTEDKHAFYLVQPLYKGLSLAELLQISGEMKVEVGEGVVLKVFFKVAAVLEYLSQLQLFHSDLSLSSIFLTPSGQVFISDFEKVGFVPKDCFAEPGESQAQTSNTTIMEAWSLSSLAFGKALRLSLTG